MEFTLTTSLKINCLNCLGKYSHSIPRVPKLDYTNRFLKKSWAYAVSPFFFPPEYSGLLFVFNRGTDTSQICLLASLFVLWMCRGNIQNISFN